MGTNSNNSSNSKNIYSLTTTTNPYTTSTTSNFGTTSKFNSGTAFDTINKFVNNNMNNLLEQYLNPTINSVTNQAKLNSFSDALANQTYKNLENSIVNPLSKRNMLRSSQATNLYNNLSQSNAKAIADYANNLVANSQNDVASMLNTLMYLYMNGYSAITDNQRQSLATSQGNSIQVKNNNSGNSNYFSALGNIASDIIPAIRGSFL